MKKPKKQFAPDFYIIPRQVSIHPDIEPLDEKVYAIVYWFEHLKDGYCKASNETIAQIVKPSKPQPRSIQNALTRLEKAGFIKRTFEDKQKRIRKEIKTLVKFGRVRNDDDTPIQNEMTMTQVRNHDDIGYETTMTRESNIEKVKEESNKITPKKFTKMFFEEKMIQEQVVDEICEKIGKQHEPMVRNEMSKFIDYWTEPNASGSKVLWETKPTFEVKRRFGRWLRNITERGNKSFTKGKKILA